MAQDYNPPPPIDTLPPFEPVPAPKKNKTTMWIIIAVVVVVLCCCSVGGILLWQYGDQLFGPFFQNLGGMAPVLLSLI